MGKYGEVALIAVKMVTDQAIEPRAAWQQAANSTFGKGSSQAHKGCPRDAFLGICEEGMVKGVLIGKHTRSRLNKEYAVEALRLLATKPYLAHSAVALWGAR